MPEDRSKYKIEIEVAGSQAAAQTKIIADGFRDLGQSAKQAGDHIDIGLKPDAFTKVIKPIEDVKKHVEGIEISSHVARHGIHLLGEAAAQLAPQLGDIGQLASAARSPEFLVPAGALIGWKMLNDALKDVINDLKDIIEWNRRVKESTIEASNESLQAIRAENAEFMLKIKHQFDSQNTFKELLEQRLALYDVEQNAVKSLIDLETKRFHDYIAYLVQIGAMTSEQATEAETKQNQAADDAKEDADERKKQADIDVKTKELGQAKEKEVDATDALPAARKAKDDADTAARKNKKDIAQEQDKYSTMDAAASEAEERALRIQHARAVYANPNSGTLEKLGAGMSMIAQIQQDFNAGRMSAKEYFNTSPVAFAQGPLGQRDIQEATGLRAGAEQEKGHIERMQNKQVELDANTASAAAEVKKWEDAIVASRDAIHTLTKAVQDGIAELAQQNSDYAKARDEKQRTADAERFYRTPHDQESDDIFKTFSAKFPTSGDAFSNQLGRDEIVRAKNAAFAKLIQEYKDQMAAAALHTDNNDVTDKILEHLRAIFASHAQLNASAQAQLNRIERELEDLKTRHAADRGYQH